MPPRGFYHAAEAGQLAGVSGNTIGQWKRRGYIRASREDDHYPNVYAYQDIGEAMIVHALISENVPRKEILSAIDALRDAYGYDWPLTHADIVIADYGNEEKRSLVIREDADAYFDLTQHHYDWQYVISPEHVAQVARELHRGGWAAREMPELEHIEVHPDRFSGRPVIRGTRVPAGQAARMALAGQRFELAEGYDLTNEQIDDAVKWFNKITEYEAAA